jgi:hypothetical protein
MMFLDQEFDSKEHTVIRGNSRHFLFYFSFEFHHVFKPNKLR